MRWKFPCDFSLTVSIMQQFGWRKSWIDICNSWYIWTDDNFSPVHLSQSVSHDWFSYNVRGSGRLRCELRFHWSRKFKSELLTIENDHKHWQYKGSIQERDREQKRIRVISSRQDVKKTSEYWNSVAALYRLSKISVR